jgi:hypothetical protein
VRKLSVYAAVLAGAAMSIAVSCSKGDDASGLKPAPLSTIPGHDKIAQDTAPKEGPRVVPPEAYLRTYLQLFGGLSPLEVQAAAKSNQLFDTWNDYLGLIGLPDYATDIPRGTQTNALMLATFERIGIALCDKALEHDLKSSPAKPIAERRIYAFDMPAAAPTEAEFAERFDVMHRTFLGYPAALAATPRTASYFKLYNDIVAAPPTTNGKFKPEETGWAAICYGLVRHPEFHLY